MVGNRLVIPFCLPGTMKSALLLGAGVPIRYDVFSSELLN